MYKVMIVDDEYIVRMDLRTMLDWRSMGFELMEDAIDGKDALAKIAVCSPDILLLDISMPGMNGTTLLVHLKEMHYQGRIVMFSCHDDFDHVKEALMLGADEYLLKHRIEPDILVKTLENIVVKLEEGRKQSDQMHRWAAMAEGSLQMHRRKYLQQLLRGYHLDIHTISHKLDELELHFSLQLCVFIIINIHDMTQEKQRLGNRSFELLKDRMTEQINLTILDTSSGYCFDSEGRLHLILGFSSEPSFLYMHNLLYSVSNQVLDLLNKEFNVTASIGVSEICSDARHIPLYCQQAQEAVNGVFFLGKNRVIHYSEVKGYCNKLTKGFKLQEPFLLTAITTGKRIAETVQEIYQDILKSMVSLDEIKSFNFEFISFIKKIQREYGINEQELFGVKQSPYEVISFLETVIEVQTYLHDTMVRISEMLRTVSSSLGYRKEIANAISYMMENYAAELSLEIMASYINMNTTYFSNLFKKETKENFVSFLQKVRIEKAKVLLRTSDNKVNDIAAQVGIGNYHYFCKTFKLHTGITPVQYRQASRLG